MTLRRKELQKILTCAALYSKNLLNRDLAFVFNHSQNYLEARFQDKHFLHLTGARRLNNSPRAETFLSSCLDQSFNPDVWDLSNSWCKTKLKILPRLMNLKTEATELGPFDNSYGLLLQTDEVIGNSSIKGCLGLRRAGDYYVPNTALREDLQKLTPQIHKIELVAERVGEHPFYRIIRGRPDLLALPYSFLRKMDFSNIPVITTQKGKSYVGRIVSNRENDCYQVTHEGLVRHSLKALDSRPQEDTITWIGYCKEKGYTRLAKPQEIQLFKDQKAAEHQLGR